MLAPPSRVDLAVALRTGLAIDLDQPPLDIDQPGFRNAEAGVKCSGQVKTDTQLSNQSKLFIGIGTNIPKIRMLPPAIVEHLDGINDVVPGLLTRGVITMRCPLALYTAKEPLSHRIVETLALLTPATDDPMVGSQGLVGVTGVLTATVRMVSEPRRGRATSERHPPCVLHYGGLPMMAHRPAHDFARIPVHQHRQIQPTLRCPYSSDVAGPHVIGSRHVKLTRQQIRRDLIAVSAVRCHGTSPPGTLHGHPRLAHQPPRLCAASVKPFILELCGHATTTITVTRFPGNRLDTGS
jgi:hypothetical protein